MRTAIAIALVAAPALASEISLQSANPRAGSYAARVEVASSCSDPVHASVSGQLAGGVHAGCSTLVSDAEVTAGSVVFTAGDSISLESGFAVLPGAELTAEIDAARFPDAYLVDETPNGITVYATRYYVDADELLLGAGDRFYAFVARDRAGDAWFRVGVKWNAVNGGERRLFVEALEKEGGLRSTENGSELLLPSGWHWVEIGWTAASGPASDDGTVYLCLDDLASGCSGFGDLDNGPGSIDSVLLGAVDVPAGNFGRMDLDDFESREGLFIGPAP